MGPREPPNPPRLILRLMPDSTNGMSESVQHFWVEAVLLGLWGSQPKSETIKPPQVAIEE